MYQCEHLRQRPMSGQKPHECQRSAHLEKQQVHQSASVAQKVIVSRFQLSREVGGYVLLRDDCAHRSSRSEGRLLQRWRDVACRNGARLWLGKAVSPSFGRNPRWRQRARQSGER